jgi:acyl carrier protein
VTRDEIYTRLSDLLVTSFEVDAKLIKPQAQLFQELGLDSIDAIDMVVTLQEWTGKPVPEEALRAVRTVDDVVSLVADHVADVAGASSADPSG